MNYFEEHRDEILKKYTDEELKKDIDNFLHGKGKLLKVLKHFFFERMLEASTERGQYVSPMDVMTKPEYEEYMEWILSYIKEKSNFYTGSEVTNVLSFFRNAGRKGGQVSQFPCRTAREIYERYYPNHTEPLNCLDTSSGFGSRMSAALLSGNNYFSTDPNKALHDDLMTCARWYYDNGFIQPNQTCELVCQGSEVFIPEWENTMDVAFTSPPYFCLEHYSNDGGASTNNEGSYEAWLEEFVKPTAYNTYRYLKVGGYCMWNIKNMTRGGNHRLFDDCGKIFNKIDGLEFLETFDIEQTSKKVVSKYANYAESNPDAIKQAGKEPVFCFRKTK